MKIARVLFILVVYLAFSFAIHAEVSDTQQQLSEFNLVSYGDKGKKQWEINGKSADILSDIVKLTKVEANVYGAEETINLTADKGDFDRAQSKMHLQDNVVITTTSGSKLTTDSLDWDRQTEKVTTKDQVNLERESLTASGVGAEAQPNLKKFSMDKDIKVQIKPDESKSSKKDMLKNRIYITCNGPLEVDYENNVATFKDNVVVDDGTIQLYSDVMDVHFKTKKAVGAASDETATPAGGLTKIVAKGNVKIVRGENTSYSDEATYNAETKKLVLSGRPRLEIFSTEGLHASP